MAKSLLYFTGLYHQDWTGQFINSPGGTSYSSVVRFAGSSSLASTTGSSTTFPWSAQNADTGNLGTNYTDGALTCAIATSILNSGDWWLQVGDSGVGCQLSFQISFAANTISIWRGLSSGTVLVNSMSLGTSLNRAANSFTPIQLAWKIDGSAGTLYARIGGTEFVNLSSQNTKNTANTQWNRLCIGGRTIASINIFTCDIGIWNMGGDAGNTLNLEYRSSYGPPTGDNAVQFTHSTGASNFGTVDETPMNSDTDYNSDTVAGHEDKFNISNPLIASGATIYGLKVVRYSRIDDATPHTMKSRLYSGASHTDGATTTETSSYHLWEDRIDNDPATGVPWVAPLPTINPAYNLVS